MSASALSARVRQGLADTVSRVRQQSDVATAVSMWALIGLLFGWAALLETQFFVVGIIVGSVLALGAVGLTLIYGILRFANFAHGDMMMLGGYLTFFFLSGVLVGERLDTDVGVSLDQLPGASDELGDLTFGYGFLIALGVSALALAVVSVGLDVLVFRPLRRRGSGIVMFAVASLGIAFATRALIHIVWGPDPRFYFKGIHRAQEYPFDVLLKTDQIFTFGVAVGIALAVYILLYRTKLGKAMRAFADNADLALVSGINTDRVIVWTWIFAGVLMAIAGSLLALQANLKPDLGFAQLLPLFAAAILGGIGKPQGAFVGALVVGVAQETSVQLDTRFNSVVDWITSGALTPDVKISAGYKPGVAFVILILILLLRPRGLFGSTS
jgi:branched-chain amino acid transport system permease protein